MINTLLGEKNEMSQVFMDDGAVVPVTVLTVGPCIITQIKTMGRDGYQAVQLGFGTAKNLTKPIRGHLKKSGALPRFLREVRIPENEEMGNVNVGKTIRVEDVLTPGDSVSVTGTSKGKGFAGVIKRWGFHTQPKTHGQGTWHRAPGSIGAQGVGKVFKGKKMAGRMGSKRITVKGLKVIGVDSSKNMITIKGAVPGNRGGLVIVRKMARH